MAQEVRSLSRRKCTTCRIRKVKCERSSPAESCHQCTNRGEPCSADLTTSEARLKNTNVPLTVGTRPVSPGSFNDEERHADHSWKADRTPLINAIINNDTKMVELLLRAGADPEEYSKRNGTCLEIAARQGILSIVERLVTFGVEVDGKGVLWPNALTAASSGGHIDVVEYLLGQGAQPSARRRAVSTTGSVRQDGVPDAAGSSESNAYLPLLTGLLGTPSATSKVTQASDLKRTMSDVSEYGASQSSVVEPNQKRYPKDRPSIRITDQPHRNTVFGRTLLDIYQDELYQSPQSVAAQQPQRIADRRGSHSFSSSLSPVVQQPANNLFSAATYTNCVSSDTALLASIARQRESSYSPPPNPPPKTPPHVTPSSQTYSSSNQSGKLRNLHNVPRGERLQQFEHSRSVSSPEVPHHMSPFQQGSEYAPDLGTREHGADVVRTISPKDALMDYNQLRDDNRRLHASLPLAFNMNGEPQKRLSEGGDKLAFPSLWSGFQVNKVPQQSMYPNYRQSNLRSTLGQPSEWPSQLVSLSQSKGQASKTITSTQE